MWPTSDTISASPLRNKKGAPKPRLFTDPDQGAQRAAQGPTPPCGGVEQATASLHYKSLFRLRLVVSVKADQPDARTRQLQFSSWQDTTLGFAFLLNHCSDGTSGLDNAARYTINIMSYHSACNSTTPRLRGISWRLFRPSEPRSSFSGRQ